MKKLLLGSTALVAASIVSSPAFAQLEVNISGQGFYEFGAINLDDTVGDENDFNFASDTDIVVSGRFVADNGLTFGASVELSPESDSDVSSDGIIDESFVYISGNFGRVIFGRDDGAADYFTSGLVPVVNGFSVNETDDMNLDIFARYDVDTGYQWRSMRNEVSTAIEGSQTDTKITYFTPRFAGFQLGVSYAPNPCENDTGYQDCVFLDNRRNWFEVGGEYDEEVNDVEFRVVGGYGQGESGFSDSTPREWSVGASIGFQGLRIGGSYAQHDLIPSANGVYDPDTKTDWIGFVQYDTGPLTLYGQYGHTEYGFREQVFFNTRQNVEQTAAVIGSSYMLGPGITVGIDLRHVNLEERTRDNFGTNNNADIDGWAIATGIGLSF